MSSTGGPLGGLERAAIIDPAAIRHNVRTIAAAVSPAKVLAAVKADGLSLIHI